MHRTSNDGIYFFLRTSVLLILGQNYSDSAVCRLRLCIFQSYCSLFHTYSLNSCSKPGKERQAPLSVPVVLRIWFPQVVQVSFPPQLFTLFPSLPPCDFSLQQLRHVVYLEASPLYSALFKIFSLKNIFLVLP